MSLCSLGALPPKGQEWTTGKTAASIKFVRDVETQSYRGVPFGDYETYVKHFDKITAELDAVKSGKKVLTENVDVLEWFKKL